MKMIYSSPDIDDVYSLQAYLNDNDMDTVIYNEDMSLMHGMLLNRTPDGWSALYLLEDSNFDAAKQLICDYEERRDEAQVASGRNWTCNKCGEENPHEFEYCWNCAKMKGDQEYLGSE